MSGPESRRAFHDELGAVHDELLAIGRAVADSVPRAMRALLDHDLEAADYGIAFDDEVDARTMDIEDHCLAVMALQAPVAGDLRQIATALRLAAEVERAADLVANVCKAVHRLPGALAGTDFEEGVRSMAGLAGQLLTLALDSYAEGDELTAITVADLDRRLDEVHLGVISSIFDGHEQGSVELPTAIQLAMIARFFERIGDHAVNISERVRFMLTGARPVHEGAERYRRRPHDEHPPEAGQQEVA